MCVLTTLPPLAAKTNSYFSTKVKIKVTWPLVLVPFESASLVVIYCWDYRRDWGDFAKSSSSPHYCEFLACYFSIFSYLLKYLLNSYPYLFICTYWCNLYNYNSNEVRVYYSDNNYSNILLRNVKRACNVFFSDILEEKPCFSYRSNPTIKIAYY